MSIAYTEWKEFFTMNQGIYAAFLSGTSIFVESNIQAG